MPGEVLTPENLLMHKQSLERQELDCLSGGLTADQSVHLLSLYLYFNKLVEAKHFWKRIPQQVKESCVELCNLWRIGQAMINRDLPQIHKMIEAVQWSDSIKQLITILQEKVREQTLNLVSNAYTSIDKKDLAQMLHISNEELVKLVTSMSWEVNTADLILPVPRPSTEAAGGDMERKSAVNLESLTRLVSYLEN